MAPVRPAVLFCSRPVKQRALRGAVAALDLAPGLPTVHLLVLPLQVVQRLLAAGGDPTALDSDGRTALEDAEAGGHTQVAEALRKATEAWDSGAAAAAAVPAGTRSSAAVGCLGGRSEAGGPGARRLEQRAMLGGSCRAARLLAGAKAVKQSSFAMVSASGGRRGAARQAVAGAAVRRAHQQPMHRRPARQVLRSSALPLFAAL